MTRLAVVLPLEPLETGATFSFRDWPLHLTIVPVFEASVDETIERMSHLSFAPITVSVGDDDGFGPSGGIPVSVIRPSRELTALHHDLTSILQPVFENPAFTGDGYRGHITVKRHGRVHPGDRLTLAQLALVDLTPGRSREVLATCESA